jgi:hypothetical protein
MGAGAAMAGLLGWKVISGGDLGKGGLIDRQSFKELKEAGKEALQDMEERRILEMTAGSCGPKPRPPGGACFSVRKAIRGTGPG